MKSIKKISLMLAAVFTFSGAMMANNTREGKKNIDPKVRAEKMTERMAKEYELNDTQKQQLLEVNQALAEKVGEHPRGPRHHGKQGMRGDRTKAKKDREQARADRPERKERAARPSAEEREKRMNEMKQVRDDYNAQLQKIMNADQYQAFTKKQAERAEKRKEHGEKAKQHRSKKSVTDKDNKSA